MARLLHRISVRDRRWFHRTLPTSESKIAVSIRNNGRHAGSSLLPLGPRTLVSQDAMKKHPLVAVRPSSIHGQGLFALRDIPWGIKIIEYSGERINDAEANRRIDHGRTNPPYTLIDGGPGRPANT